MNLRTRQGINCSWILLEFCLVLRCCPFSRPYWRNYPKRRTGACSSQPHQPSPSHEKYLCKQTQNELSYGRQGERRTYQFSIGHHFGNSLCWTHPNCASVQAQIRWAHRRHSAIVCCFAFVLSSPDRSADYALDFSVGSEPYSSSVVHSIELTFVDFVSCRCSWAMPTNHCDPDPNHMPPYTSNRTLWFSPVSMGPFSTLISHQNRRWCDSKCPKYSFPCRPIRRFANRSFWSSQTLSQHCRTLRSTVHLSFDDSCKSRPRAPAKCFAREFWWYLWCIRPRFAFSSIAVSNCQNGKYSILS